MRAHAQDLRAEVQDCYGLTGEAADAFVGAVATDWRRAPLPPADRALAAYAEKLTRSPAACTRQDVETLRGAGLGDREIHDAVQVIAYFNYINRVADGLGVDEEPGLPAWERGGPLPLPGRGEDLG